MSRKQTMLANIPETPEMNGKKGEPDNEGHHRRVQLLAPVIAELIERKVLAGAYGVTTIELQWRGGRIIGVDFIDKTQYR